ncbi:hypothetical protein DKK66_19015 [Aquitalea sp. USM4]|nr:hypothetical protein DKK66_19015 [Aquitalea sp. USM4]
MIVPGLKKPARQGFGANCNFMGAGRWHATGGCNAPMQGMAAPKWSASGRAVKVNLAGQTLSGQGVFIERRQPGDRSTTVRRLICQRGCATYAVCGMAELA